MKLFGDHQHGPLDQIEDLDLYGTVSGDVTVPAGRYLVMRGLITGDLMVAKGGRALISGTVDRFVFNNGGEVDIAGTAKGICDTGDTVTTLDVGAKIG
jgi:hypothetical protein